MVHAMMDNGRMVEQMEKEHLSMQMEMCFKVKVVKLGFESMFILNLIIMNKYT